MIPFTRPRMLPPSGKIFLTAIPLAGLVLILVSMNLYQYYKAKHDIASANIIKISDQEFSEIQSFFNEISTRLNVVRGWGENGLLKIDNTVELNKKFFPFMDYSDQFTGLLLADNTGSEYYLYRIGNNLVTRSSTVKQDTTEISWQQWAAPDRSEKVWQETSDYDTRKRPWFIVPEEDKKVHWTKTYSFSQNGQPVITGSTSWLLPGNHEKFLVFGLDILAEDIQNLIAKQEKKRTGILFMINTDKEYYLDSSKKSTTDFNDRNHLSERQEILSEAIRSWKADGKFVEKVVTFTHDKQRWLAHFKYIDVDKNPIWIGVTGSEKDLASQLHGILFKIDIIDILVAAGGGLLLLMLALRISKGDRTIDSNKKKITPNRLKELIDEGENVHIEFKSNVRHNLITGKTGKEIELAWLKAVIAFLNTAGGTLLIGVADDGTVVGIDNDAFDNDDRCLLHIKNLINQHIGAEYSPLLDMVLQPYKGFKVVVIECKKSPEPVFLTFGKNEEFYIRSGPSNTKLSPSKIISYLEQFRS